MESRVLIGIRRRNGTYYLAEHDPEGLSLVLNDPDFYNPDEELVQQFLAEAKEAEIQTEIHPSEYGVILIDLVHRMVLSRQSYCSVGRLRVAMLDLRKIILALKVKALGMVGRMYVEPKFDQEGVTSPNLWGPPDPQFPHLVRLTGEKQDKAFSLLDRAVEENKDGSGVYNLYFRPPPEWGVSNFVLYLAIPGFLIDDRHGERAYTRWGDVLRWLKHTGWDVPAWTKKQVADYVKEMTPPSSDRLH